MEVNISEDLLHAGDGCRHACSSPQLGAHPTFVDMTEPLVLHTSRGTRWVVHPPYDPYGDGRVWRMVAEIHDGQLSAVTDACLDGQATTLTSFVAALATDWRGWQGVRRWQSLEGELELDARHDGRAQVSLGVTLRAPGPDLGDTRWGARAVLVLEAGEELSRLVADLADILGTSDG